jgi:hypothetical protein
MSHISKIATEINSLPALDAAVIELSKGRLHKNVTTYHSYQGRLKCDHVIRVPGVSYEIGVIAEMDGKFTLHTDFYGYDGSAHDGHKLKAVFGEGCMKLKQYYNIHKATMQAKRLGHFVQRQPQKNGGMRLVVTGVR